MNLCYFGGLFGQIGFISRIAYSYLQEIDGAIIFAANAGMNELKAIMVFRGVEEDATMSTLRGFKVYPYYQNPDNAIMHVISIGALDYSYFVEILREWYMDKRVTESKKYLHEDYYDFSKVEIKHPREYMRG